MSEMSSIRKIQSHNSTTRSDNTCEDREISRRARIRLDIHTPFIFVQSVNIERPFLAKTLEGVDVFGSAIVSQSGITFRVFIIQA